ncbi:hypothetical protein [Paraburkholderia kururiensis]|uniref:hypothetical protein n=1 Tax=Paraburkholderia kururiensis TaxID=984307 RepID=UPI0005A69393|nr:hypothetical protein [Paraburkholderia kururiensis]
MLRFLICTATLACGAAFAADPANVSAPPSQTQTASGGSSSAFVIKPTTAAAAPNQLFPPVPSLASLPGSASDDEDTSAPVAATGSSRRSKKWRHAVAKKAPEVQVRVVVTEESRMQLAAMEKKLDAALQERPRDRRSVATEGVSVAMTR